MADDKKDKTEWSKTKTKKEDLYEALGSTHSNKELNRDKGLFFQTAHNPPPEPGTKTKPKKDE